MLEVPLKGGFAVTVTGGMFGEASVTVTEGGSGVLVVVASRFRAAEGFFVVTIGGRSPGGLGELITIFDETSSGFSASADLSFLFNLFD